jgi:hypothetical protein
MPQPKKRKPVNNPDLERVVNDIRGIKQTGQSVNPLSTGTIESDALNAVGQSVRGTSGNPFRGVGNGNPYNPTPAQKRVSDDILGRQPTEKIINPFPAGTIEGDGLNAVGHQCGAILAIHSEMRVISIHIIQVQYREDYSMMSKEQIILWSSLHH